MDVSNRRRLSASAYCRAILTAVSPTYIGTGKGVRSSLSVYHVLNANANLIRMSTFRCPDMNVTYLPSYQPGQIRDGMEGPRSEDEDNYPVAHTRVLRAIRVRTPPGPALSRRY